jgi:predicted dehydrogenase
VWEANLPKIEIYGSEGTLGVPDPNGFQGPVRLWHHEFRKWDEVPLASQFIENWRGIGVVDMAHALRDGRPHRANESLAYHVLDIMHAVHHASREGRHVELRSACERPEPLPAGELHVVQPQGH